MSTVSGLRSIHRRPAGVLVTEIIWPPPLHGAGQPSPRPRSMLNRGRAKYSLGRMPDPLPDRSSAGCAARPSRSRRSSSSPACRRPRAAHGIPRRSAARPAARSVRSTRMHDPRCDVVPTWPRSAISLRTEWKIGEHLAGEIPRRAIRQKARTETATMSGAWSS